MTPLQFLYVDLFCGAGGVTTGIEEARVDGKKVAKVIACVNHDAMAIKSHAQNHKKVLHFTEDIRTLDLTALVQLVAYYRAKFPHAKLVLWASLECTNFSKAKGGMPRDADSRTLAEHLDRYVIALNPDMVQIENVEEFMSWGPLDERGKPISRKNGRDFRRWVEHIEDFGYSFDYRILNAADFGAYTSRKRFFAQFAKPGVPVVWPKPTHSKTPNAGMFGSLKPWKAVRDVLDFSDEGQSIFGRKKPLVEATLARIYAGLQKYVSKGEGSFLSKQYSGNPGDKNIPVYGPAHTVTTVDHHALVNVAFLSKYNSGNDEYRNKSLDEPCDTITTANRHALVQVGFLDKYYGTGVASSLDEPAGTLTTKDRLSLVIPQHAWLDKYYSGTQNHTGVDGPAGTVMPNDKHALVQCTPWIMPTSYTNTGRAVTEPCPTVLASRKHHYLVNPQFKNKGHSVEVPAPTLIAQLGKRPISLATAEAGSAPVVIAESDSPYTKLIKQFMLENGLCDIKMRMLKIPELKLIQGFRRNYYLAGNQSDQKKFIGNSVPPKLPRAMVEANAAALIEIFNQQLIAA